MRHVHMECQIANCVNPVPNADAYIDMLVTTEAHRDLYGSGPIRVWVCERHTRQPFPDWNHVQVPLKRACQICGAIGEDFPTGGRWCEECGGKPGREEDPKHTLYCECERWRTHRWRNIITNEVGSMRERIRSE